eukprot:4885505-Prymnesium_polylepis.1
MLFSNVSCQRTRSGALGVRLVATSPGPTSLKSHRAVASTTYPKIHKTSSLPVTDVALRRR